MKTVDQYHDEVSQLLEHIRGVVDIARSASANLEQTDVSSRSFHNALWRVMNDVDSTIQLVDEWFNINQKLEMV